jgi:hypothetical protein
MHTVLVIGADNGLALALERMLPEAQVREVRSPADTEGLDTDVVVVAGPHPLDQLAEVRVHPNLHDRPVVLAAPGHRLSRKDWRAIDVWPITEMGFAGLDELTHRVGQLLARAGHPTANGPSREPALSRAS